MVPSKTSRWLTLGVLGIGLAVAAACGSATGPSGPAAREAAPAAPSAREAAPGKPDPMNPITGQMTGEPKYGGVFIWNQTASGIAPHLDVHQSVTNAIISNGVGIVYSRLFQYNTWADADLSKSVIEGDVAKSWKLLPDNVTYEITIHPGIKWQNIPPVNGRELTVDDVIYSFNRQATPGWANASQVSDIAKMEKVDNFTLRISTKAPNAGFISNLADGHTKIVPRESVEVKGDLKTGPIIGTGAFILEDGWNRSTGYKFRKNPDYFKKDAKGRQLPYVDGLELPVLGDAATRLAAMRTGQLSQSGGTAPEIEGLLKAKPELVVEQRPGIGSFSAVAQHLGFKSNVPPFDNVKVRQAFDKALDRQQIVDTVVFGRGMLTVNLQLPSQDWHIPLDELRAYWKQDIPGAKKLLAEAGYPNGLDVEMTTKTDGGQDAIAELIVAQTAKVGFRVKLRTIDNPTYADAVLTSGKFSLYNGTGLPSADPNVDLYRFWHSKSLAGNTAGVNDPKLDEMIDRQRSEFDPEKRKALLKDIQWYLVKNAWYTQIYQGQTTTVRDPRLRNFNTSCCYDYSFREHMWFEK